VCAWRLARGWSRWYFTGIGWCLSTPVRLDFFVSDQWFGTLTDCTWLLSFCAVVCGVSSCGARLVQSHRAASQPCDVLTSVERMLSGRILVGYQQVFLELYSIEASVSSCFTRRINGSAQSEQMLSVVSNWYCTIQRSVISVIWHLLVTVNECNQTLACFVLF